MASVLHRIIDCGVVAVLRADSPTQLMDVSRALREGGVEAIEVTMTVPGALKVIEEASAKMEDTIVGVGTVLDPETARAAILSGAEYVVSPVLNLDVVAMAKRYGKAVMPAGFTPTDALHVLGRFANWDSRASRLGPRSWPTGWGSARRPSVSAWSVRCPTG